MGVGWGNFFGGIGEVIGKVTTFFPGRVEKLKNERQRLLEEKDRLLSGRADAKKAQRMAGIDARLRVLDGLLVDNASD